MFEAFEPTAPGQSRTDLAKTVARQLGVERTGITALYFADTADWEFVMGEELLRKIGKTGDDRSLAEWQKSLQSQAKQAREKWIASAEQRADKPVTDPQKIYMRIATMLEEIVQAFSPKTNSVTFRTLAITFIRDRSAARHLPLIEIRGESRVWRDLIAPAAWQNCPVIWQRFPVALLVQLLLWSDPIEIVSSNLRH